MARPRCCYGAAKAFINTDLVEPVKAACEFGRIRGTTVVGHGRVAQPLQIHAVGQQFGISSNSSELARSLVSNPMSSTSAGPASAACRLCAHVHVLFDRGPADVRNCHRLWAETARCLRAVITRPVVVGQAGGARMSPARALRSDARESFERCLDSGWQVFVLVHACRGRSCCCRLLSARCSATMRVLPRLRPAAKFAGLCLVAGF